VECTKERIVKFIVVFPMTFVKNRYFSQVACSIGLKSLYIEVV